MSIEEQLRETFETHAGRVGVPLDVYRAVTDGHRISRRRRIAAVAVTTCALLAVGVPVAAAVLRGGPSSVDVADPGTTTSAVATTNPTPTAGTTSGSTVRPTTPLPPPPPPPPVTSSAPTSGSESIDRCHTSQLTATLTPTDPAAGNRYATVALTNSSGLTCRIFGYGGMQLLDAARTPLPTDVVRDTSQAPTAVLVRPGEAVAQLLHWSVISGSGEAQTQPCQPVPAYVEITPPDETDFLLVQWSFGPVCEQGRIDQLPYS